MQQYEQQFCEADPATMPPKYSVYVTVQPTERNMLPRTVTFRINAANDMNHVHEIVEADKLAMDLHFHGFVDPSGKSPRTYHVYKSLGWIEIKC